MSPRRNRYPDHEAFWITLSADAVVGLAALGDQKFARLAAEHHAQRAANEAAAKSKTTRSPK